jgi:hypothetical protein
MTENDIIKMINRDKGHNSNLFGKQLSDVHSKVIDQLMGKKSNQQQNSANSQNIVEMISKADYMLRDAVNTLAMILIELKDKELAQQLLGEHILMLSEIYKSFDNLQKQ